MYWWLRRAAGSEKKTSAVADATDNAVNMMVCCEVEVIEGTKVEYRRVMAMRLMPDIQVSSVVSGVLMRGEDGLGKEARALPLLMYES